jgi:NADH-quinone oxidoreductase subunit N
MTLTGVSAPVAALLPLLLPLLGALTVLLLTVSGPAFKPVVGHGGHLLAVSVLALLGAALALVSNGPGSAFGGSIAVDGVAQTFGVVTCLGSVLCLFVAMPYLKEHELAVGEFFALVLLATVGALTVICGQDLLVLFLGIELMSIAAYVLAGFRRALRRSQEAALKYFMYGAFASAVMVFGMALVWGEIGLSQGTASLRFDALARAAQVGPAGFGLLGWLGVSMLCAGMAFKVAAVPFHMWAPDVYEGAPTPSAAFLSVVVKTAAFAGFARLLVAIFGSGQRDVETATQVIELLAMGSMVLGNLLAVRQVQIKRMLAYSSIGHAGYVLTGLCAIPQGHPGPTLAAAALYLCGYAAAAIGAFGVVLAFERADDRRVDLHLDRLTGAAKSHPGLALAMAIFMLALAGIPPTAGFAGKVGLFGAALGAGRVMVVLVAALASVVGAFYYLRVLSVMFMEEARPQTQPLHSPWLVLALWLCGGLTLLLGICPNVFLSFAQEALANFPG